MKCPEINNDNKMKSEYVFALCPLNERINNREVLYTVAYRIRHNWEIIYYWIDSCNFTSYNPNFKASNEVINQILTDQPSQFDNIICFNSLQEAKIHFKYIKDKIQRLINDTKYYDRPMHLRDYEDYRWTIIQIIF